MTQNLRQPHKIVSIVHEVMMRECVS